MSTVTRRTPTTARFPESRKRPRSVKEVERECEEITSVSAVTMLRVADHRRLTLPDLRLGRRNARAQQLPSLSCPRKTDISTLHKADILTVLLHCHVMSRHIMSHHVAPLTWQPTTSKMPAFLPRKRRVR